MLGSGCSPCDLGGISQWLAHNRCSVGIRIPERIPQGQMPHIVHHCVLKDAVQSAQHSADTCYVKNEGRNEN